MKAWIDRPRIEVSSNLTTSPEVGNQIAIYNHSSNPINILGWNIYRQKRWPRKHVSDVISSFEDGEMISFKIEPHTNEIMNFREQNHFSSSYKARKDKGALRIKLYIAGRKLPVVKKLEVAS